MCTQLCQSFCDLLLFGCCVGLYCEPSGNTEGNVDLCVSPIVVCVLSETHISVPVCLVAISSLPHPASSASWMQLDLQLRGPAAPGSGGAAALCASRGLEESSSACLFTLCTLITNFMPLSTGLRPLSLFIVQLQGLVSPMYPKVSPDFYLRTCMSCSDNACI